MPGPANPQYLNVQSARRLNGLLITLTVIEYLVSRNAPIGDVDVPGGNVDVIEKLVVHEPPVAFRMLALKTVVFVQVEGDDVPEAEPLVPVRGDQALVEPHRGRTSRQAEHHVSAVFRALADQSNDLLGDFRAGLLRILAHDRGNAFE